MIGGNDWWNKCGRAPIEKISPGFTLLHVEKQKQKQKQGAEVAACCAIVADEPLELESYLPKPSIETPRQSIDFGFPVTVMTPRGFRLNVITRPFTK
jgi:hypothetical protein